MVKKGLIYLANLSELPEDLIFKICVEFWHFFTDYLIKNRIFFNLFYGFIIPAKNNMNAYNQPLLLMENISN